MTGRTTPPLAVGWFIIDAMRHDYRDLAASELDRIRELDRSEHVTTAYAMEGDALVARTVDWNVPR